jgi:hypothetical protein
VLISVHITGLNNNPMNRHVSMMIAITIKIVTADGLRQAVNGWLVTFSPVRKLDFPS